MNKTEYIKRWEYLQEIMAWLEKKSNLNTVQDASYNQNLLYEVVVCQRKKEISDRLGVMFLDIATKLANKYNCNDEIKQEMIQTGVTDACHHYNKFNFYRSTNAFAYVVQIIKSGFAKEYRRQTRDRQKIIMSI